MNKQQNQLPENLTTLENDLADLLVDIDRCSEGDMSLGFTCDFYDLDALTQGFQRTDLIVIGGRPGMGKTSLVTSIVHNVAKLHQLPVVIFYPEATREKLLYRLLATATQIESSRLRTGRIALREWELLSQSIGALAKLPITIDDTPNPTVSQIYTKAQSVKAEQGDLGLLVIDYLQLLKTDEPAASRVEELSSIVRSLKLLARELDVPVIVVSQLSRSLESRVNKRPLLSDLQGSGSIEDDADVVLMLYRDEYYYADTPDRGVAEVRIAKHRQGPVGTVELLFDPQFCKFSNLAPLSSKKLRQKNEH